MQVSRMILVNQRKKASQSSKVNHGRKASQPIIETQDEKASHGELSNPTSPSESDG